MRIPAELDWLPCRATQRKDLIQITEDNFFEVLEAVGGTIYFSNGERRLAVGGTQRTIGQWVDRSGSAWPDPHDGSAPFAPDRTDGSER